MYAAAAEGLLGGRDTPILKEGQQAKLENGWQLMRLSQCTCGGTDVAAVSFWFSGAPSSTLNAC